MAFNANYFSLLVFLALPINSFGFSSSTIKCRDFCLSKKCNISPTHLHSGSRLPDNDEFESSSTEEFQMSLLTRKQLLSTMNLFAVSIFTSVANAQEDNENADSVSVANVQQNNENVDDKKDVVSMATAQESSENVNEKKDVVSMATAQESNENVNEKKDVVSVATAQESNENVNEKRDSISISACIRKRKGGKDTNMNGAITNCVSTASGRKLDLYAPPWTFETTAEEAVARLKRVIAADGTLQRNDKEDLKISPYYLKVRARRRFVEDEIEFLINPQDKVVTFRSEEIGDPSVSDFGEIRKRLESIRQSAGVFGVMGAQFNTADLAPKNNGPLGQLKAFYGLQSGKGFEDVLIDN